MDFLAILRLLFLGHFVVNVVYQGTPYISYKDKRQQFDAKALRDRVHVDLIFVIFLSFVENTFPMVKYEPRNYVRPSADSFYVFLIYMFLAQLVDDFLYYVIHRALHVWAYSLHKLHHTVKFPTYFTTTVFDKVDYWLEGDMVVKMAIQISFALVELLPFAPAANIRLYYFGIVVCRLRNWFSFGAHFGKRIPVNNCYASILFSSEDIIECHDLHHSRNDCNFGLTPLFDKLFGTYVAVAENNRGSSSGRGQKEDADGVSS